MSTTHPRSPLRRASLWLATTVVTTAAIVASAPNAGAASDWQTGKHDEDVITDCYTGQPATGLSADVGWRSPSGQVPQVGEVFYVRAYAGLVSLPCNSSGAVAVLPELMLPTGVIPADDKAPIYWDLTPPGASQQLKTTNLTFGNGRNGGYLIGNPEGLKWEVKRGAVLEIQVPVIATRELKGPATQQPECQTRLDGTAPCPITQSGDHFQMAFTVGGHGGNKSYVTPYVGLFAQAATGGPGTGPGTGPGSGPGNGSNGSGVRAASTTKASVKLTKRKVVVEVASTLPANGTIVITDKGRTLRTAPVSAGSAVIKLPRLERGKHVLVATFSGSTQVLPSSSPRMRITVR